MVPIEICSDIHGNVEDEDFTWKLLFYYADCWLCCFTAFPLPIIIQAKYNNNQAQCNLNWLRTKGKKKRKCSVLFSRLFPMLLLCHT